MKEIKEHFSILFKDLTQKCVLETTYSNGERIKYDHFVYNNYTITFKENSVITIYQNNASTERIHHNFNSIVQEISEERFPLFSFSMF
jgi:hypothetical protein